ncbi:hypothetical protein FRC12_015548 [Ceratobasidium sp. 428]|nr:hypothetical protein FRC12_015548 [Ceratobasidium sp. 428]
MAPEKVESVLFKIHRSELMKSETFSDMFQMANKNPEEGSSPESPIILEGVKALDFECLLIALYSSRCSNCQLQLEGSQAIPAFRLAYKWNFEDLQTSLVPLVKQQLNEVDQIVFAQEFGLEGWIEPAYLSLCRRREPLTLDEGIKIGIGGVILVSQIREEVYYSMLSGNALAKRCYSCAGWSIQGPAWNCTRCSTHCTGYHQVTAPNHSLAESKIRAWVQKDVGS